MPQVVFLCSQCKLPISRKVTISSSQQSFCQEDGKDLLPEGTCAISDGKLFSGTEGKFLLNIKDATNVCIHPLSQRLNGCCGLDGCDGINKICTNGHEIGTEKSDCWMPHVLLLEPEKVIKEEAP